MITIEEYSQVNLEDILKIRKKRGKRYEQQEIVFFLFRMIDIIRDG